MTCEDRLQREGRKQEASLFNLVAPELSLHDTCNYRCTPCPSAAMLRAYAPSTACSPAACSWLANLMARQHTGDKTRLASPSQADWQATQTAWPAPDSWPLGRYPMYIESDAWVTNLKQKLGCGSILISNKMEYYEFFTRALQPGLHYVQVDPGDLCNDTAFKVGPLASPGFSCGLQRSAEGKLQPDALPWPVAGHIVHAACSAVWTCLLCWSCHSSSSDPRSVTYSSCDQHSRNSIATAPLSAPSMAKA